MDAARLFDDEPHATPLLAWQTPRISGAVLRDQGMRSVTEHEAEAGDWGERANEWIKALVPGTTITSEDLCAAIGRPTRHQAVGAVFSYAARQGRLREVGTAKAERPGMHATRLVVWERTA